MEELEREQLQKLGLFRQDNLLLEHNLKREESPKRYSRVFRSVDEAFKAMYNSKEQLTPADRHIHRKVVVKQPRPVNSAPGTVVRGVHKPQIHPNAEIEIQEVSKALHAGCLGEVWKNS